jgi:hypothetical protein
VAPDAPKPPEPLQQVEPIEQLVKQIIRLAQNTTAMVQTALLPQQRTGTQGLAATTRRIPPSAASSNGATVDAILIVLGKHDQLGAHKEAAARPASGEVSGNAANGIGHSQETLERVDDTA